MAHLSRDQALEDLLVLKVRFRLKPDALSDILARPINSWPHKTLGSHHRVPLALLCLIGMLIRQMLRQLNTVFKLLISPCRQSGRLARQVRVNFDAIYTTQDVGSYKP